MLAIPIFRSRVAPALNWCSRVLLFSENDLDCTTCKEELLTDASNPFERLRILRNKGVTTVICGALSPDLLNYAEHLNLQIICGVAGNIPEVLKAYQLHQLDRSCFRLPGCRQRQCHRRARSQDNNEARETMPRDRGWAAGKGQGTGFGQGQEKCQRKGKGGRMGGQRRGAEGSCFCHECGATVPHERGTPCAQIKCPKCGQPMIRPR